MDDNTEYCYNLLKPNGRIKEICQDTPIFDESTITNDNPPAYELDYDSNYEWYIDGEPIDGEPNFGTDPLIDKPWYQDIWDGTVEFWTAHASLHVIAAVLAVALVAGFIWWIIDRARWVDLADDNYEVEDYIEDLNQAAAERGGSAEFSPNDDQYAMG